MRRRCVSSCRPSARASKRRRRRCAHSSPERGQAPFFKALPSDKDTERENVDRRSCNQQQRRGQSPVANFTKHGLSPRADSFTRAKKPKGWRSHSRGVAALLAFSHLKGCDPFDLLAFSHLKGCDPFDPKRDATPLTA